MGLNVINLRNLDPDFIVLLFCVPYEISRQRFKRNGHLNKCPIVVKRTFWVKTEGDRGLVPSRRTTSQFIVAIKNSFATLLCLQSTVPHFYYC